MTHPDTQHSEATYGGPPNYPTSQMVPPEFWRKEVAGDPDHGQYQTIEIAPGVEQKRAVRPGWDNSVNFKTKDYLLAEGDEDTDNA